MTTEATEQVRRRKPAKGNTPRRGPFRIEEPLWLDYQELVEALGQDVSTRVRDFMMRDIRRHQHLLKLGRPRTAEDLKPPS
jgi:hypothetical protein